MKIQDVLKRNHLFQNLTALELDQIAKNLIKTKYARNELIIEKDEDNSNLFFILSGKVEASMTVLYSEIRKEPKYNRKSVIDFHSMLEVINLRSVIGQTKSITDIRCIQNTDVVKIPSLVIADMMNVNRQFRNAIYSELANLNNKIITRSAILPALNVEERIMVSIGRYSERKIGVITMGNMTISKISELSSCSREMASKVFKKFQQNGLVIKDGREILISEEFYEHCVKNNVLNKIQ